MAENKMPNKGEGSPQQPSGGNLLSDESIFRQLPSGIYVIFTDLPVPRVDEKCGTFSGHGAYFCLDPYATCKVVVPGRSEMQLEKSCSTCWALQDKLIEALPLETYKRFNLIHWGPQKKQHGTMLGPLNSQQYDTCEQLITQKYQWIPDYTFVYEVVKL